MDVLPISKETVIIIDVEELIELQSKKVVIHCASGGRSRKVSKMLKEAGFSRIYDYSSGLNN